MMTLAERIAWALEQLEENDKVLAQKLGVNKNTIGTYRKGRGDFKGVAIEGLAKHYNFSTLWLLKGEGEPYLNQKEEYRCNDDSEKNIGEPDQSYITGRFRDKHLARDINQDLAFLEKTSPEAFQKVGSYIKGMVEGLKMAGELAYNYNDRRKRNDPDKIPETGDRRSGDDRRQSMRQPSRIKNTGE